MYYVCTCVVHVLLCIPERGVLKWYVQLNGCAWVGLVCMGICSTL